MILSFTDAMHGVAKGKFNLRFRIEFLRSGFWLGRDSRVGYLSGQKVAFLQCEKVPLKGGNEHLVLDLGKRFKCLTECVLLLGTCPRFPVNIVVRHGVLLISRLSSKYCS